MSVPLSATGRITVPYTIGGLTHKFRVFVRNPQAVGASYNINSRALDANDIVWTDALNDLCTTLSWQWPAGVVVSDGVLEHQSGGIWTVLATAAPTYTDHGGGAAQYAWQLTLVMRDINLKKVKFVDLETNYAVLIHWGSYASISHTETQSFVREFTSAKTLTNAPYVWAVSRGNQYLYTSPFVGLTYAPNRRIRRRRGMV